ncbi:MAG: hypothetical protein GY821_14905 [Gammaproteobacteria bacterium]|nr:hypothetical protein [Gammaproteobacteria bacterium]
MIIDVVYFVAKSDYPRLSSTLETLLTQQTLDKEAVASILRHQMIYCGCPWSMNAFSVLNSITTADK